MEESFFTCCHCWERVSILVDVSVDGHHHFVEDCEVCCNPMDFSVEVSGSRVVSLHADITQ